MNQLKHQRSKDYTTREKIPHLQSPGWLAPSHSSPDWHRQSPPEGEGEPMQLARTRLTQEEQRKQQLEGRCFYCGESGHLVACPAKKSTVVSQFMAPDAVSRILNTVKVTHHTTTELRALIDSGADADLMN